MAMAAVMKRQSVAYTFSEMSGVELTAASASARSASATPNGEKTSVGFFLSATSASESRMDAKQSRRSSVVEYWASETGPTRSSERGAGERRRKTSPIETARKTKNAVIWNQK
jgi:hypothetical protein